MDPKDFLERKKNGIRAGTSDYPNRTALGFCCKLMAVIELSHYVQLALTLASSDAEFLFLPQGCSQSSPRTKCGL